MQKLKEQNPPWNVFYVVFHKVQCTALNTLIYILMTFAIYMQIIQTLFSHDSTTSLCNTLNTELEKLNAWPNLSKLSLNLHKTNYITFFINNLDGIIQIAIYSSNIENVNSTKYLDVYIDHHVNWKDHIACISSKLSK